MRDEAKRALNAVAARCSKREYCSTDVEANLRRRGLEEDEVAEALAFLVEHRFVDDQRFADAYARDKARVNRWGRVKIAQMLRGKRLPGEVIERALAGLPGEAGEDTCLELLRQKARGLKETEPVKRKAKLYRFALQRGFEPDVAHRCLEQVEREAGE